MFCKNCGFENLDSNNYCPKCGQNMEQEINNVYTFDNKEYCSECGEKVNNNYCAACGAMAQNFQAKKNSLSLKNIINIKQVMNEPDKAKRFFSSIEKNITDKEKIKTCLMSSLTAIIITCTFSVIISLIIKNAEFAKELYDSIGSDIGKMIPNFIDYSSLMWQNAIKMKVNMGLGVESLATKFIFTINAFILLIIPIFSVFIGNKLLRKNKNVKLVDYAITSLFFTIIFNILLLVNRHMVTVDFLVHVEYFYGSFLFKNIIGIFTFHFLISALLDSKYILDRDHIGNNVYINLLLEASKTVGKLLIFSMFLSLVFVSALSIVSKDMIVLIALPNMIVNGLNLLTGGVLQLSSNNKIDLFSGIKSIQYYNQFIGDEPIFILSLLSILVIFIGVVYVLLKGMNSLKKAYRIKEVAIYSAFTIIIIQMIAFVTRFKVYVKVRGYGMDAFGQNSIPSTKIGFFNIKSILITTIFIGIICIGGYYFKEKFELDTNELFDNKKTKIGIYGLICAILICIQILLLKNYNYNSTDNFLMSLFENKLEMVIDQLESIFEVIDIW